LLDQLRSSADQINDIDVIHVEDPDTCVFQRLECSHV